MKFRLNWVVALLIAGCVLFTYSAHSAADDYIVIVHAQSTVAAMNKSELGDIYLKKTTKWKNGLDVEPIELTATNPVRMRFSQEILGKPVAAVQAYWRKLIFSGQAVPPIELAHDGDILNYVSNHRGAIGYITASTYMEAANVKKVRVTD